jgi:hypothetical protein
VAWASLNNRTKVLFGLLYAAALVLPAGARADGPPPRPFTVVPAPYVASPRLSVTYAGSGWWQTVYHSDPPDPGGAHDTNEAHDTSHQSWSLRFSSLLTVRRCDGGSACVAPDQLPAATGSTTATGTIDHTHIDGLYSFDNASEACRLSAATQPGEQLQATVSASVAGGGRGVTLQALSPVSQALLLLPVACPGQGDPLDGLNDDYFTPGLSFASGFGPDRWFTSAAVLIPLRVLERAARITIPMTDTLVGTPPENCGPAPSFVRCQTQGRWHATLTLSRVG